MKIHKCIVKCVNNNTMALFIEAESENKLELLSLKSIVNEVFSLKNSSNVLYKVKNTNKILFVIPIVNILEVNARLLSDIDNLFDNLASEVMNMTIISERIKSFTNDFKYVHTKSSPSTKKKSIDKRC